LIKKEANLAVRYTKILNMKYDLLKNLHDKTNRFEYFESSSLSKFTKWFFPMIAFCLGSYSN